MATSQDVMLCRAENGEIYVLKPITTMDNVAGLEEALEEKAAKTPATSQQDGLMSKEDKAKLDSLSNSGGSGGSDTNRLYDDNMGAELLLTNNGQYSVLRYSEMANDVSVDLTVTDLTNMKNEIGAKAIANNKADKTVATQSKAGLMSAADKKALDGLTSAVYVESNLGISPFSATQQDTILEQYNMGTRLVLGDDGTKSTFSFEDSANSQYVKFTIDDLINMKAAASGGSGGSSGWTSPNIVRDFDSEITFGQPFYMQPVPSCDAFMLRIFFDDDYKGCVFTFPYGDDEMASNVVRVGDLLVSVEIYWYDDLFEVYVNATTLNGAIYNGTTAIDYMSYKVLN